MLLNHEKVGQIYIHYWQTYVCMKTQGEIDVAWNERVLYSSVFVI